MAVPEIALRFREAVKDTVASLREHPLIGPHYPLRNPRSWPVMGFDAIHVSYLSVLTAIRVIRVLHQKRNIRRILEKHRDILAQTEACNTPCGCGSPLQKAYSAEMMAVE